MDHGARCSMAVDCKGLSDRNLHRLASLLTARNEKLEVRSHIIGFALLRYTIGSVNQKSKPNKTAPCTRFPALYVGFIFHLFLFFINEIPEREMK